MMPLEKAIEVLKDWIGKDNDLYGIDEYVSWRPANETIILDGSFTIEQLEAMVVWMKSIK